MKDPNESFQVAPLWPVLQGVFGFTNALNYYAPYVGAGISVSKSDPAFRWFEVSLDMGFLNQNYVGSHFGGSLYAMCDPFYMFILMQNLGEDYIVWDKSASIDFIRPGQGKVTARFEISAEEIAAIKAQVDRERKMSPVFEAEIVGEDGKVVAKVHKTLYVRRKKKK